MAASVRTSPSRRLVCLVLTAVFAVAGAAEAVFTVKTLLRDGDEVEPSTMNEVERALDLGEAWLAACAVTNAAAAGAGVLGPDFFGTNGLDRTAIAHRLVSLQRADGHWESTNRFESTRLAVEILRCRVVGTAEIPSAR